jgi:hypothetical protein
VLRRYVASIEQTTDPWKQDDLASRLCSYISKHSNAAYTDAEIDEVAQMLQDNRVRERFWIVEALVGMGLRVRRAEPYLQALFAQELCAQVAAHVRRRYGMSTINAVEGEILGLGLKPKPALCPSGPEPGAPLRYYDDPVLQHYLELNPHRLGPLAAGQNPPTPPNPPAPDHN